MPALILAMLLGPAAHPAEPEQGGPVWWEAETALNPAGGLEVPLEERSWWADARNLAVGESLLVRSDWPGGGWMIVRRDIGTPIPYDEPLYAHARALLQEGREMIVWILDDDGDLDPASPEGDVDSDVYVVDYGADGVVDRMLDYIDEDGDDDVDLQDQRYFSDGLLRHSIMQLDLDDDSHQYPTHDYQRVVGTRLSFLIDAYDENVFYHNKYDPETQGWLPLGECPFSFYDLDGDGFSDRALRVSAAPLDFSTRRDPDYANSWVRMMAPIEDIMRTPGIMAVRYSADIDGGGSAERPLHYEVGFHMTGAVPYDLRRNRLEHPLRRPPRVSYAVPHEEGIALAESYPAEATGYSWREFADATTALGDWRDRPEEDRRWEGVFWTWQRRFMPNTGGPEQFWNVRREYDSDPSDRRTLYYSPVDHRLHLKGAEEGWLPVGAIVGEETYGEVRMYDTTGDGYFDRWEYWRTSEAAPYRTSIVPSVENRDLGSDLTEIGKIYQDLLLPTAVNANRELVAVLRRLLPEEPPDTALEQALASNISEIERLYLLDIERELLYQRWTHHIATLAASHLGDTSDIWLPQHPDLLARKAAAWHLATLKARADAVYERGEFKTVATLLEEIGRLAREVAEPISE